MRLDDYVMTERDKCRLAATLSTPEGRERLEKASTKHTKPCIGVSRTKVLSSVRRMFPLISNGWQSIRNSTRIRIRRNKS